MSDDDKPVPEENVPPGLGRFVEFLRSHPRLKAPSIVTIVAWIVLLVGGGILHLSDAHTSARIDKASKTGLAAITRIHNVEACTLRTLMTRLQKSAKGSLSDPTTPPSAKNRAKASITLYTFILDGQVTSPVNVNCKVLLRKVAQAARARNPIGKVD